MNNKIKYTPIFSFAKYLGIKARNTLVFEKSNIGQKVQVTSNREYTIFREIYLRTKENNRMEGNAVFQVVFHVPKNKIDEVIERTDFTIPFFIGLPRFCNKQFMVNRNNCSFSGKYEWETTEMAHNYANSYACRFMKRRSMPYPLYYRIIDKTTGQVIERRKS